MQMRLRRRAVCVHRQVTGACLRLGGPRPHQAGDLEGVLPWPRSQAIPDIEQPLGPQLGSQHHRGWPLPGRRNRLVHATAPSFLGNSYIGTVAEGYPLARVPLIRVRMRSRILSESEPTARLGLNQGFVAE